MKTRRILSLVVAAILVVSTLAVVGLLNVTAAETEISDAAGLQAITGDGTYKLTQDIDLTGANFTTIASFAGTLDGNGKTIKGLTTSLFKTLSGEVKNLTLDGAITTEDTATIGALACTVNGTLTVTNVTNNVSVEAKKATKVGGFIGSVTNAATTTFTRIVNNGDITANQQAGGIIAFVDKNTNTTITESINNGDVKAGLSDCAAAGFVCTTGWANSSKEKLTITYSVNTGAITGSKDIVSSDRGRVGGFVARFSKGATKLVLDYCYNVGAIHSDGTHGDDSAAGLLSYGAQPHITNCYNVGQLTSENKRYEIGRSQTSNGTANSSNNYYIERGIGNSYLTTTAVADKAALEDALLALGGYCVVPGMNNGYPILKWQCEHKDGANCLGVCYYCEAELGEAGEHAWGEWVETTPATAVKNGVETKTCSKCGDSETRVGAPMTGTITPVDGVYEVYTGAQFTWLTYHMNAGTVGADVNIAIKDDITITEGQTYINKSFSGTFDGEGHTISGLNAPIFYILGGIFKNVTLEGEIVSNLQRVGAIACATPNPGGAHISNVHSKVDIKATYAGGNHGGIIGYTLGYCTIIDSTYSGTLTITTGSSAIGGIVGYTNRNGYKNPVIDGCVFDGAIVLEGNCDGVDVGGIYGNHNANNGGDQIRNCVVSGSIVISEETTTCRVGGIAGCYRNTKGNTSVIENCVFNGTITGNGTIGAIAGSLNSMSLVKNTAALTTDYPLCAVDEGGEIVDSYAKADVQPIGNPITIGGATYQEYNFGFLNVDTLEITAGLKTENEFAGYITMKDIGDKHTVKFVLVANMEKLNIYFADVKITFTKGEETVQEYSLLFGNGNDKKSDFEAFRAGIAAGEPYFAADGCALFGAIVNDIPDGAWDSVSVTITDGTTGDVYFTGSTTYAQ